MAFGQRRGAGVRHAGGRWHVHIGCPENKWERDGLRAERMLFIRCGASLFYVGQVGGTARDPKNVKSSLGTEAVARPKHVADLSRRTASTSDSSDNEAEAALSLHKIRVFPE